MTDYSRSELWCSWSQLKSWSQCRGKFARQREGKRSKATDYRVFLLGNICDRAMRLWLADGYRQPGQMAARLDQTMAEEIENIKVVEEGSIRWKHSEDKRQVYEQCAEYVRRLEPILLHHVTPYDLHPAYNFKVPLRLPDRDGNPRVVYLKGEMDVLLRYDPERWGIWDLKITKNESYWRETIGQIAFYALARDLQFPGTRTVAGGLIQPACSKPVINASLGSEAEMLLLKWIKDYAQSVWAEDLPINDDTGECFRCDVKHACPKFSPVVGSGGVMDMTSGSSLLDLTVLGK